MMILANLKEYVEEYIRKGWRNTNGEQEDDGDEEGDDIGIIHSYWLMMVLTMDG